ncbi:MAG: NADH-quinone oxidoreductase subunit N [Clostridia bacterium]
MMIPTLEPEFLMGIGVLVTLVLAMIVRRRSNVAYWSGLVFAVAAGVRSFTLHPVTHLAGGMMVVDSYGLVVNVMVIAAVVAGLLLSFDTERYTVEFPALILLAGLGGMIMGLAANFILLFLGLELLSLPLYILAASRRDSLSGEAGLKYLLTGAFSSGVLLFGMALLYGATGTVTFINYTTLHLIPVLMGSGLALVVVGLSYKLAIVPFHMWVPDVYEGSPTPVTTFMAFGTKVAAAAALLRVLAFGFSLTSGVWGLALGYFAVLTMLAGNLLALPQRDLKRLLAWSGVGNAGYVLVGIASHTVSGAQAALFYLLPYGMAIVLAFGVIRVLEGSREGAQLDDLTGLVHRDPWLAAAFSVALLSLAGIPLTAGFFGKFYLIKGALQGDQWGMAIGLVVATLVSLAVYFRPIQYMFRPGEGRSAQWSPGAVVVVAGAALVTLFIGVYPEPLVHYVTQAATFTWLR